MENLEGYLKDYKDKFESYHSGMTVDNHHQHNPDPEYWAILLGDVKFNPERWKGKKAFDFGCGCGRNLYNLSTLAEWERIDGCDISRSNAKYAKEWFDGKNTTSAVCETWENNGDYIQPIQHTYEWNLPYKYDFIMSHIVFQHISNYNVRLSLMKDMYEGLNEGGLCSLHFMDLGESVPYFEDSHKWMNCRVEDEQYLVDDFKKIGFKDVSVETGKDYLTSVKSYYIKGTK